MCFTQVRTSRGSFGVRHHGEIGEIVVRIHGFPDDASTYDGLASALVDAGYRSQRSTSVATPRRRRH